MFINLRCHTMYFEHIHLPISSHSHSLILPLSLFFASPFKSSLCVQLVWEWGLRWCMVAYQGSHHQILTLPFAEALKASNSSAGIVPPPPTILGFCLTGGHEGLSYQIIVSSYVQLPCGV